MPKGIKYCKKVIRNHLLSYHSSGLSASTYCKKSGLARTTFHNWLRQESSSDSLEFIELDLSESKGVSSSPLALRYGDFEISIPPDFEKSHLTSLLMTLQEVTHGSSSVM